MPTVRESILAVALLGCMASHGLTQQTPVTIASEDQIIPYAAVKRPPQPLTPRRSIDFGLPVPLPQKGILLSNGTFFGPGADWIIVDFGSDTIEWLRTVLDVLPDGQRELVLTSKAEQSLTESELNLLIRKANEVWNPPPGQRPGSPLALDVTCDIALFDKDDVLNQWGFSCPYNSQNLISALNAIQKSSQAKKRN